MGRSPSAVSSPPSASPAGTSPGPLKRIKRGCLRAFQAGLGLTGVASLYVRFAKTSGAVLFNYHALGGPESGRWVDPRYQLSPAAFERQMRFLRAKRRPVPLSDLVDALRKGESLPPRTVVVTFDDGYLEHLTVAGPILLKYGIPATFFLPTGYITRAENQWVDRLHSAFTNRTRHAIELEAPDLRRFDLGRRDEEREARGIVEHVLLTATYPERQAHLERVEDQLRPSGEAPRRTLDWDEVRRLRALSPGFDIGGHSRDHIDLAFNEGDVSRREIADCAADLERELGPAPRDFSYPYERWTRAVRDQVRTQGFRSALGEGTGLLVGADGDRFAIPRLDPIDRRSTFGFVTSGAYPALSKALTGRA